MVGVWVVHPNGGWSALGEMRLGTAMIAPANSQHQPFAGMNDCPFTRSGEEPFRGCLSVSLSAVLATV